MKYLILLALTMSLFGSIYAHATPEDCASLLKENSTDGTISSSYNPALFLATCGDNTIGVGVNTAGSKEDIRSKVKVIAQALISLGALLAVGAIVWSGIQYTKALGEDENLKKAKTTGTYAIIGLLLLLLSFGLVESFIGFVYRLAGVT